MRLVAAAGGQLAATELAAVAAHLCSLAGRDAGGADILASALR